MSKRTKWLLAIGVIAALVVGWQIAAFGGPIGLASGFEDDDGDLANNAAVNGIDWNTFNPVTWLGTAPYREADKVDSGWTFKGIEDDQVSTTDTAFAGGVKQDDNCAPLDPGKAPNKDDLKRIYLSTKNVGGDVFLNLAWVRIPQNTTSASAHVGFEFNQNDGDVAAERCGSGSPLVQRKAGDLLIVYDFAGSSTDTPKISLRKWITSGTCEVGSSTPPCWGEATNLTQTGVAEAKVNTSDVGSVLDRLGPSGNETLGNNEFGEAGINLTDAGVFGPNTCQSFGKVFGVSRSSGNSEKAAMKDLVGPGNFTLANCGTVTIRKQTSPDEDPNTTDFNYTTNVTTTPTTTTSPFSLKDDGVKTIVNVNPGSNLNVTEGNPGPNYALTSINCDVAAHPSTVPAANRSTDTTTRAVTFSIAAGETLDCTFTNTLQQGAIKILKKSTKTGNPLVSNAGAVFSYDDDPNNPPAAVSVTDNGTGDEDSTIGEVCVSGLKTGAYTVNETSPPSGYGSASQTNLTANAVANTDCTNNQPAAADTVTFTNPPLADIQVRFRDGGSGETKLTSAGISCDNPTGTTDTTDTSNWDDTTTVTGIKAGASTVTVTCTIPIDP